MTSKETRQKANALIRLAREASGDALEELRGEMAAMRDEVEPLADATAYDLDNEAEGLVCWRYQKALASLIAAVDRADERLADES